jgi:hypothetical protein
MAIGVTDPVGVGTPSGRKPINLGAPIGIFEAYLLGTMPVKETRGQGVVDDAIKAMVVS